MNKKVSNKIVYLNFILAFLILNLHSAYMELFDTNNTVLVINQFVRIVCNMAVPTFFFVSAMLFYRSCKRKRYKEVIIAKTRSLLIPYLCWNIICFPLKEMKNVFGGGTIASVPEIIRNILSSSYDPVLWFIRVLFIYFLFYPVNVCLLNKKKIYPFLIVVIFFINIYIGPKAGYATCRYWLPVYMLGAYIGLQIVLFIWAMNNNYGLFVCRMISPIFYWVIADIFQNLRHPLWVMKQSFFYYCTQMIFSIVAQKIYLVIFGKSAISAIVSNVGIPFILMLILMCVALTFCKVWPKGYAFLTGGRT